MRDRLPAKLKSPVAAKPESNFLIALNSPIRLTKWTSQRPVTKHLSLESDGSLKKVSSAAQIYDGSVAVVNCTPTSFVRILSEIGADECLSYGIPVESGVSRVLSSKLFDQGNQPIGAMTRTSKNMKWANTPSLLMFDYDPFGRALSRDALLHALYVICSPIQGAAHVWSASASSCLTNVETGKSVRDIEGQRVYVVVADGTDIPRAASVLCKRAWLNGHGYIKVSKSGAALQRSLIDESVFQPTRIDFCAPAICEPPLVQKKPKPRLFGNPMLALNTREALPDLTAAEQSRFEQLVSDAKASAAPAMATAKAKYRSEMVECHVKRGISLSIAEDFVDRALDTSVLYGEFGLLTESGQVICVRDILLDRARWHGARFADPMEPDYHDDRRIATAFLVGTGLPTIFSHAHGGRRFALECRDKLVRLEAGARHAYVGNLIEVFRQREAFFNRAGSLVFIGEEGNLHVASPNHLRAAIDRMARIETFKGKEWSPADAPLDLAKLICDAHQSSFDDLDAVMTAPCIDPKTGRLVASSGYDAGLRIMFNLPANACTGADAPTLDQVRIALQVLWYPVSQFPFATAADETVMLAAMLTAVIRLVLPTAPAFAFDAPIQASGKSLLAKVLAALSGMLAAMSPQPGRGGDDELRKRLFGHLRGGDATIVIDNIIGDFDSAALAALLTSEWYSDRVLGESRTESLKSTALVVLTGNNIVLRGDLPRRVLKCRIDPNTDSPHERVFDFDPVAVVQESRQELVGAALTLMRAYFVARPRAGQARFGHGRTASFEVWDDCVRQTVCWLATLQASGLLSTDSDGQTIPALVDPMSAINAAVTADATLSPLGRLLAAWAAEIGTGSARASTLTSKQAAEHVSIRPLPLNHHLHPAMRAASAAADPEGALDADEAASAAEPAYLDDVIKEIAGDRVGTINTRTLAKSLSSFKDRMAGGRRLRQGDPRQGAQTWWVEDLCEFREIGESVLDQAKKNSKFQIPLPQKDLTKLTNVTPIKPAKRLSPAPSPAQAPASGVSRPAAQAVRQARRRS